VTPADELLERQIDSCLRVAIAAESPDVAREVFAEMGRLIDRRSPERVREMEIEKGLCARG
jgi:hypothetical protein